MRIGSSKVFHRASIERNVTTSAGSTARSTGPTPSGDGFDSTPMKVSLGKVTGYTQSERAKLDQAAKVLGDVLNSREFKDALLNHTYDGRPGFADETRSPTEIYAAIRAAKENFTAAADGEVDLNLHLKSFSWFQRKVVGYTTPSSDTVTTNRRFFSGFEPGEMAAHLAHEWLHKLGFEHDHAATADRPYSVPYAIGDLVERLARGPLTPL